MWDLQKGTTIRSPSELHKSIVFFFFFSNKYTLELNSKRFCARQGRLSGVLFSEVLVLFNPEFGVSVFFVSVSELPALRYKFKLDSPFQQQFPVSIYNRLLIYGDKGRVW